MGPFVYLFAGESINQLILAGEGLRQIFEQIEDHHALGGGESLLVEEELALKHQNPPFCSTSSAWMPGR